MANLIVLKVDNRPAEDEEYTICAIVKPMNVEVLALAVKLQEMYALFSQGKPDCDEEFVTWLKQEGYVVVDPPVEIIL